METRAGRFSGRWIPALIPGVLTALAAWPAAAQGPDPYFATRIKMVRDVVEADGVTNKAVLKSMRSVPRHLFCRPADRKLAYRDGALPIGFKQTISPPFVVAYMTQQLDPQATDKVLEIGTGSGYQAAVLSQLADEVYSIEIVEPLARRAETTLKRIGCKNVHVRAGDGYQGWPEQAPFDRIIVTCSPDAPPQPLVDQLKEGGRMIIPVGEEFQQTLFLYRKTDGKLESEALDTTFFVPMTGTAEQLRVTKAQVDHPAIVNGGFEETFDDRTRPAGWYYVRNAEVEFDDRAPQGRHCLTFAAPVPGRGAQALQAIGVDGRKVRELEITYFARGRGIRPDDPRKPLYWMLIEFFDEQRAPLKLERIDAARDTFPWTRQTERVKVPPQAMLAVIKVGLLDATGELSIDDFRVAPAEPELDGGKTPFSDGD
jgi:protein-L-isoaspartate(D-aspartate) O-methyltransferase